jgi:uncharacterized protein (TIGR03083 family)
MVIQMTSQEHVAALPREGGALARAARRDPVRRVPFYPEWSLADLVAHTGGIHRWVLQILRTRAMVPVRRQPYEERDPERLLTWFEEGVADLAGELGAADPDELVWSFSEDQTVGFWQRRMAHETAVHRWDAQSAFGDPEPIERRLAATGIPESLAIHVVRHASGTAVGGHGESVALRCDDGSASWVVVLLPDEVRVEAGDGSATATVAGTCSDLWLFVMGRPTQRLRVLGDAGVVAHLERVIRSAPPPTY